MPQERSTPERNRHKAVDPLTSHPHEKNANPSPRGLCDQIDDSRKGLTLCWTDARMSDTLREFVLRRVWLREDLKPVQICMGDPPRPIEPDWLAISHWISGDGEGCNLVFFRFTGDPITSEQFDTLQIALDQAHAIVGVKHSEWQPCHVEIKDDQGRTSWQELTRLAQTV
jgi:hypothetical protein